MKVGGSKQKINKKLTKQADTILDWDNKKANPSIVKRIIKATDDENNYFDNLGNDTVSNPKSDLLQQEI